MKTLIKTLIGLRLRKLFLSSPFIKGNKGKSQIGKILAALLLYLLLASSMLILSVSSTASMAILFIPLELDWMYFLLVGAVAFFILFFFGIFEAKAELFECKDNSILLPLPIRSSDIVTSRILVLVIYHYLEALFIFAPAIVVYLLFGGETLALLGGTLVFLVLPWITASLSSVLGFFISKLMRRIKNKTLLTLICAIAFLGIYFYFYTGMVNGMDAFFENANDILNNLADKLAFFRPLGEIALSKPLPLILFLLVSALLGSGTWKLVTHFYFSTATEGEKYAVVLRADTGAKTVSPLFALVQKELRRFTSSANYMLQCGIGLLFALAIAVFALVKQNDFTILTTSFGITLGQCTPIAISLLSMTLCMNYMGAVSLSLEGDAFWVVRSLPVSSRTILLSKFLSNALVSLPFSLLASILMTIALRPGLGQAIALFTLPILSIFASSAFYVLVNVLFPKMHFENEMAVVKQSLGAFVGALGSMLVGMGALLLSFFLLIGGLNILAYLLLVAIPVVVGVPSLVLLLTVLPRKIENL